MGADCFEGGFVNEIGFVDNDDISKLEHEDQGFGEALVIFVVGDCEEDVEEGGGIDDGNHGEDFGGILLESE